MRHARSILLIAESSGDERVPDAEEPPPATFQSLRQWQRLGGLCSRCAHEAWLDRYDLQRRFGAVLLVDLQPLLRCTRCQSKGDNRFIIGAMARD
ncbi:hypothetical protein [Rhizobium sp. TRM95796]|uniref:hypothetical protein n=1 Tax=Rhizobium sp. TRM95796 TaxID=2979862 RepID=UPI0021E99216|nr:hypothetical protein [Rhizobium sp. TRM95796]MCV3766497.1 hypothetical protein [Rhizobium sp. TRM95796]